jgi:hypothetical protein
LMNVPLLRPLLTLWWMMRYTLISSDPY